MPNEVYRTTHAALSALVSPRAATQVLDDALAASGSDAEAVSVSVMRRLLAGRVRRELGGTLPASGLKVSLRKIADDLARLREPEVVQPDVRSTGFSSTPRLTGVSAPIAVVPDPPAELPPRPLTLDESTTRAALRHFGELETVRQVVVVQGGRVTLEAGEAIAVDRLANLVRSTKHLLARAGELRVFALERAAGMLFVFPVADGAIVVVTQPNVNIGAVLAARAALEEAA